MVIIIITLEYIRKLLNLSERRGNKSPEASSTNSSKSSKPAGLTAPVRMMYNMFTLTGPYAHLFYFCPLLTLSESRGPIRV